MAPFFFDYIKKTQMSKMATQVRREQQTNLCEEE